MSKSLPYMSSYGLVPKILHKIEEAKTPERFTQDFLETKLGHSGGAARAMIPLLKRIGLLSDGGEPTELYIKFKNPDTQGAAMATALRQGYKELFDRNEYANELSREKLKNLVIEVTGLEHDNSVVRCILSTFEALKEFADFEADPREKKPEQGTSVHAAPPQVNIQSEERATPPRGSDVGLNLSYTINLNLPETDDIRVFDAIFKSLKENLLEG